MSVQSDSEAGMAASVRAPWTIEDVVFKETISRHKSNYVFRVSIDGHDYLFKVYHKRIRRYYDFKDREIDPFTCESNAYVRLREGGLCDKGIVPKFYGTITVIDVHGVDRLHTFANDEYPPNAIILEYIPDLKVFDPTMFTKQRMNRFYAALQDIHQLGVLQGDIELRHMLVQSTSDRILWIDFDHAQTFPPDNIPQDWIRRFDDERSYTECFMEDLELDCQEGNFSRTARWL